MRGKVVLKRLKQILQEEFGVQVVITGASPHLNTRDLPEISQGIWPPEQNVGAHDNAVAPA
jgi:hypothetical protein